MLSTRNNRMWSERITGRRYGQHTSSLPVSNAPNPICEALVQIVAPPVSCATTSLSVGAKTYGTKRRILIWILQKTLSRSSRVWKMSSLLKCLPVFLVQRKPIRLLLPHVKKSGTLTCKHLRHCWSLWQRDRCSMGVWVDVAVSYCQGSSAPVALQDWSATLLPPRHNNRG